MLAHSEDFESSEEIYEAVGEILHEVATDRSEEDIRSLCARFHTILQPDYEKNNTRSRKILDAPLVLGQMNSNVDSEIENMTSIWVQQRNDSLKVDSKKLEKAEAKILQKQERRDGVKPTGPVIPVLQTASASQVLSKKDAKVDAKGQSRSMDIRIENFDVSFGDRVLLTGADLVLASGRRYGLVGRNGLGKTTLLRMISLKQLQIPSHISILHVEQEVVGDDTIALDSVLECDEKLNELWRLEKELSKDPSKSAELTEVYQQLQLIEADKAPAKASIILNGLGFSKQMQTAATRTFSGGWRMRLALARALFSRPDLLLLDEPTNMLDIKAIIWLEKYLQAWPTTLLVVSHDRNFLDTVPTDILYLHTQRIDPYRGNYENFEKTRADRLKAQRREWEAQMAHRAHVQEFIDRFRFNANRAASVQSKIKMLEKLPELKPVEKETEVILKFPDVEVLNPPVMTMDEVAFKYPATERVIFSGVNIGANSESRICIVGENGAGKTTLLQIILGANAPTTGIVHHHRGLKFGYFSQHFVDQLDLNVSCVEILQKDFPGKTIEEYRRQLGSFGVGGELALQIVGSLSGGQKSRVAFAKMCMGELPSC